MGMLADLDACCSDVYKNASWNPEDEFTTAPFGTVVNQGKVFVVCAGELGAFKGPCPSASRGFKCSASSTCPSVS